MKLTPKQQAVADAMRAGCGHLHCHHTPGLGRPSWYIPKPYLEVDGRTAEGMFRKGAIRPIGDGDYELVD